MLNVTVAYKCSVQQVNFWFFRYGRRPIFFLSLVLQVVFGIAAAVAPEYYTFMVCRLIIGSTTSGVFLVAYVIG